MAKVPITTSGGKTMRRSPISSMGGVFSSLKGNMKSMANSMFGLQNDLKQDNQQKQKSYQTIRRNLSKNKDLKKKKTAEKNLENITEILDFVTNKLNYYCEISIIETNQNNTVELKRKNKEIKTRCAT